MKKKFWETTVGQILKKAVPVLLGILIKKAPFIKTDQDRKNIDDILK